MNGKIVFLFTVVFLLVVAVTAPLEAQLINEADIYKVKVGDSAWRIAGEVFNDPTLWHHVVERNPFLSEPGRITVNPKNGWTYVMLHPGEELFGLRELGILPVKVSLKDIGIEPVIIDGTPAWVWWPLLVTLILLVGCYTIYRMLTRDPATAGPAMVPGGVTETNATAAMQQVAARAAGNSPSMSRVQSTYQQFTIVRQTAGRIWGNMTVRYEDGRSVPRRLNGDRAYQAEVRFPDGHTETLYMLQGCGNDLRYGGIARYLPGPEFRFEADPVIAPTPTPTPTSAPAPQTAPNINEQGEFIRTTDAPRRPNPQPTKEHSMFVAFIPGENGNNDMIRWKGMRPVSFEETTDGVGTFRFQAD